MEDDAQREVQTSEPRGLGDTEMHDMISGAGLDMASERAEEALESAGQSEPDASGGQPDKPAYDYEAERAKKLAYRASLTEEDIARIRKTGRPENYRFGQKVVAGIENTQASGDEEERKRSVEDIERDQRIEAAARVDDWQTRLDGMSFDERVQATIDCLGRRQSFARVLRSTMEYCLEERTSEDVEAYIETLPDFAANRQSARRYVFFLMRTGALEEIGYDADGNPVDERSVTAVQQQLAPAPAVDEDADVADADGQDIEACEIVGEPVGDSVEGVADEGEGEADGSDASQPVEDGSDQTDAEPADAPAMLVESAEGSQTAVDPEDLIVEWRISTTDAGRAALEATDAHGRLRTLLDDQPEDRYSAYLDLITFCEEPRTLAQISEFLIGNPGLEIDDRGIIHMQPNAYIGKLDTAGALTWTGQGWQATPAAIEVLETL